MKNALNQRAAARELGVNRETLRTWTERHKGPLSVQLGTRHYDPSELLKQWKKAQWSVVLKNSRSPACCKT